MCVRKGKNWLNPENIKYPHMAEKSDWDVKPQITCEVGIEKSVSQINLRHHKACFFNCTHNSRWEVCRGDADKPLTLYPGVLSLIL